MTPGEGDAPADARAEAAGRDGPPDALEGADFSVLTFDCYGTLVDWEAGIWEAFRAAAAADGVGLDRERVIAAYHEIEPLVESGRFRPYREVLTETAQRVAARCGWTIGEERARFLPSSLPDWPPFPDTAAALERLARAYRLGILSNVDEDLLAATRRRLPEEFEFWVTAEAVGAYKPDPAHFRAARRRIGEADADAWLHVAQSLYHDVDPAGRLGIPVAWVNRRGRPWRAGDPLPDLEVPDLRTLAERLLGP